MEITLWLAFTIAAAIVLIVPGPTILLVVAQSVQHGRSAAMPLVAGVALGDFLAITLSLSGLGMILATSADLFILLKWLGAAYLVWLGIQMWRSPGVVRVTSQAGNLRTLYPLKLFSHATLVTALNPKGIIFFMAFVPQFINPNSGPLLQLVIMAGTFLLLAVLNAWLYAWFAVRIRKALTSNSAAQWTKRGSGSLLIGAGLVAACAEQ